MPNRFQVIVDPDERFQEVAGHYLDALDDGRPDEQVRLLLEHPDLAADLATFIADQTQIADLAAPLRHLVQESIRTASNPTDKSTEFPRPFGDYELLRELGRGGMGVVYEARQRGLNRSVALKMIRAGNFASEEDIRRFRNEAQSAAGLDHPHIVPIYEIGELQGQLHFSMKWVDGPNLAERLGLYRGDLAAAARLVAAIGRAVHHAHEQGILHRDLKPSNILLDGEGRPHVTDFGLAKHLASDDNLTHTGAIVGTPTYMAPEQVLGKKGSVTAATDVYGLGAILYTLLTGRPPFVGATPLDTMQQVKEREPKRPISLNPRVDRNLQSICLKCLEKLPGKRYPTAEALAEDLGRWLAGEPVIARPIGRRARAWRWCRRKPMMAALTATAGLLLMLLIAGLSVGIVLVSAKERDTENHRQDAEKQKAIALDQAAALRRRVYVADIAAAHEAWQIGDAGRALALLEGQMPTDVQEDLRGFEWHYLNRIASRVPREIAALQGHEGDVHSVCYSPDGKLIATAGKDRTARLWDARSYRQIAKFNHASEVNCVAFSPDSKILASCTDGGQVHLWDMASGQEIRTLQGHTNEVAFVEFSPDGRSLASCSRDGTVRLWDVAAGTGTILCKDNCSYQALAISPNGKLVAAVTGIESRGAVKVWDLANRKTQSVQRPEENVFYAIAFSPDSKHFATGGGSGSLKVWNSENMDLVRDILCDNHSPLDSISYAHDGAWLVAGRRDGTCEVWDVMSGRQLARFQTGCGRLWRISAAPDGRTLATAGGNGTIRIWNLGLLDEYPVLQQPDPWTGSLAFGPNSQLLAVGSVGRQIRLWDLSSRRLIRTLGTDHEGSDLRISPDGRTLVAGYENGRFRIWDLAAEQAPIPVHIGPGPIKSAFFPDGKAFAIISERWFLVFDLASGDHPVLQEYPWSFNHIGAIGADRLVAASETGIHFWDGQRLEWSTKAIEDPTSVTSLATSADGAIIALGRQTGMIDLYHGGTGDLLATLAAHRTRVTSVSFSPDGKTLASGGDDQAVQLWHMATTQKLFTLAQLEGLHQVVFSPDGRFLGAAVSVGDQPGRVLLWDAFGESKTDRNGP